MGESVSAAIRLDIFVIDFPIMFISIIAGVLAWSKKNRLTLKRNIAPSSEPAHI